MRLSKSGVPRSTSLHPGSTTATRAHTTAPLPRATAESEATPELPAPRPTRTRTGCTIHKEAHHLLGTLQLGWPSAHRRAEHHRLLAGMALSSSDHAPCRTVLSVTRCCRAYCWICVCSSSVSSIQGLGRAHARHRRPTRFPARPPIRVGRVKPRSSFCQKRSATFLSCRSSQAM